MFLCYFKLGISFLKAYQVFYIFLALFGKYLLKVCSQTTGERTGVQIARFKNWLGYLSTPEETGI